MIVNNLNDLTKIGLKYKTDKAYFHLFTEFYYDYFNKFLDRPINILEIGIANGGSILMLKEFFPKATIYAIDVEEKSVNLNLGENINTYLCNQTDIHTLENIIKNLKFDIIIDDGSHVISHQLISLGYLFPYLNKNGIYICEDLHTSFRPSFIDSELTTLQVLNNFNLFKTINCNLINEEQTNYLNNNIDDHIEIYYRTNNALECYSCKNINYDNNTKCKCGIDLSPNDKSITSIIKHF